MRGSMRRSESSGKLPTKRAGTPATSQRTTGTTGIVQPQVTRLKQIEDNIGDMLKRVSSKYSGVNEKKTAGGIDSIISSIEKLMIELKKVVDRTEETSVSSTTAKEQSEGSEEVNGVTTKKCKVADRGENKRIPPLTRP